MEAEKVGGVVRVRQGISALISVGALLSTLCVTPAVSADQAIGLATHVDNQVNGLIAGQQETVKVGSNVYQLEIIKTDTASKAQLAFLDNTVLSVGPASEVNLDKFVYNPDKTDGAMAIQLG